MYVVYSNPLYFLSIFLFTYNKNILSQKIIVADIDDTRSDLDSFIKTRR